MINFLKKEWLAGRKSFVESFKAPRFEIAAPREILSRTIFGLTLIVPLAFVIATVQAFFQRGNNSGAPSATLDDAAILPQTVVNKSWASAELERSNLASKVQQSR